MVTVISIIFLLLFVVLYMLPTLVAYQNKKQDIIAIAVLNVLLGWSFVGWVIALIWAFTKNNK